MADHERHGPTTCYHPPSVVCFVLLSFSHYFTHFSSSLFSNPFLGSCAHGSLFLLLSPGSALERFRASEIFKPFHNSVVFWTPPNTPTTTQHLPFPHSANLSPWNLSNSPCTHSAVPLIACSLHPPLLRFLALSALAAWQLLEHSQLSSYHRLAEVYESADVQMYVWEE